MPNVAIIGCGAPPKDKSHYAIGHHHAGAWQAQSPHEVALYAVDIKQENLDSFAQKFNIPKERCFTSADALYASITPDVVDICTWPGLHHPLTIQAAEKGVKGIVCEKPMALDNGQINQMLAACEKSHTHLMICHQRRYEAAFVKARELIKQGLLGDKLVVDGRTPAGWDILAWTVHWFDMANYLLDDEPVTVLAGADIGQTQRYGHAVENATAIFVEYTQGHHGVFVCGNSPSPLGVSLSARGTQGELRISAQELTLLSLDGTTKYPIDPALTRDYGGYVDFFREMLEVLEGQRPTTRCSAPQAVWGTRLALAALDSARTQKTVKLADFHTEFHPIEVIQKHPKYHPLVAKAVLLAEPHHTDPASGLSARDGLQEALIQKVAKEVAMVPADQRELTQDDLQDADLLVLYHTVQQSTPSQRQVLEGYVKSGRPVLISHCGIGAYTDWDTFKQWIGRYWVWGFQATPSRPRSQHPHIPCTIHPAPQPNGLQLDWDEAWLPRDEFYTALAEASNMKVLATTTAQHPDGRTLNEPLVWRSTIAPNILVSLPGHRHDIWQLPTMHDLLRAAVRALVR